MDIILSVMVVSHNQEFLICRCLDSILGQHISVPWEIVISDDASADGTWRVILQYAEKYNLESYVGSDGYFVPQITYSQINSSEYSPTVTSDRCAANKANVYMHARGKYCVNIDADDYLLGDDIYQYQIDQLEIHPECGVAVQNIVRLKDGDTINLGHLWWPQNHWLENEVFTIEDFCKRRLFISNPAFMMRRDANLNPIERYGVLFDDPIISMHHMANGSIITSQRGQYVYVLYSNSIWNTVVGTDDEIVRKMTPLVVYAKFFPQFFNSIFRMERFVWVSCMKKYLQKQQQMNISPLTRQYVSRLKCAVLNDIISKSHSFRVRMVLWIFLTMGKFEIYNPVAYKICYWAVKPHL